ncbi:hypothetical protein E4U57_000160 [Claviceps arundinis]|uniref:Retrotransposon gag domain-containing protein n=1 Tax=Claviceps arundinis TaxID=1623583 RepID=A0ABQ7PDC9_9HYPO|nr:hypothetical protein E4U57_000160 [Claviceps arundinis]
MNNRSMSHNIERANPSIIENDPVQTEMQQQASSQDNPIQQDLAGNNEETETTFENQEATLSRSIAEAEAELQNLQNFLADLNVAFTLDRHAFDTDATKVAFASSCLQDDAKRQWMRYAATDGYVDYQSYSWVEFVSWLKTGGMDINSRRLEAMGVLLNLRQGKNESLHSFIKSWGKAEAEYPEPFPDSLRTVWFMQSLNSDMKQQVFRQEHPENFNHLMGLMKKAESAVDATKNENEEGTLSTLHVERG